MLRLLAATALALGILLCPTLLGHRGSKVVELAPTFFTGYASAMLGALGLGDSSWLAAFGRMIASKQLTLAGLSQWLLIAMPLFVAGTLGARLLGLPRLLRALVKPSSEPAALHFVGWFVVCGYALGLCLRVTPIDEPGGYNNSVWFIVESKLVAWTFVGVALGTLFRTWSPAHAAWTAALLVGMLAVPSTANTFAALDRTTSPSVATRDEAEVAAFFARTAAPGAVVLCESSNLKRLLLGEAGMRVPFAQEFYLSSFLRRTSLDARAQSLNQFWQAWATGTYRGDLAAKYGTDYVVSTRRHAGSPPIFERAALFVYPTAALHAR
jgi:hypothetical protein